MSKACQYVTNEVKVNLGMKQINLKDAHAIIQKTITFTKKFGKGRHEHEKVCHEANTLHKTQKPCENMFCFECNFIPRNLIIHECYQHLLHLTKFISIDYSSQQTYMDNFFCNN
jgi:hypothetical protein